MGQLIPSLRRPLARSYGLSLLATGVSVILWLLLGRQLAPSPFMLCTAAVAVSAWYGGLGPAIISIGLNALVCLVLYLLPSGSQALTARQEVLYFLVFLLVNVLIAVLQVARQRAETALAQRAFHDSLTHLPNRRLFCDRVEQALHSAHRRDTPCAVLLLDLNGFKAVNDAWGHAAGDLVLQQISRRLEKSIRAADTVGRWGGDEFAFVLPDSGADGARLTAQRILQDLAQPIPLERESVSITGSIGIALYPEHGHDSETLLQAADAAMYRSKRAGGGYSFP